MIRPRVNPGVGKTAYVVAWVAAGVLACAPSKPPLVQESQKEASATDVAPSQAEPESGEGTEGTEPTALETSKTPEFRPGMSVAEAIDAVPQGADRINVEQEALAAPLLNPELYTPCIKGHEHFRLKVAIWDGRAVGIDVVPAAKNDKLVSCVRELLEKLEWPDRVKSLNTVEFSL